MARVRRLNWRVPAGVALALVGLLLGWLWLRESSLVAVRDVTITGATTSEAEQVRDALRTAALDMTTLRVREDELEDAVATHPSVAGLKVQAEFPHHLTIEVLERKPVAAVTAGGGAVAATGNGRLLEGLATDGLPQITAKAPVGGGQVTDRRTLQALRIAAAAPEELRARTARVWFSARGVTLDLREGPKLYFGTERDAGDKWTAAARVLADASSAGATYLDLRVVGRVAAGGLAPVEPTPTPTVTNPQP